jgi:hypothetical protein
MLPNYSQPAFDLVYNAAKENNEALIKKGLIIDARKGYHTPASKLAEEGNAQALFLLLKYNANVHLAGMGAAIGKQYKLADILHQRYGANINFIAKGAAIADDKIYLESLFSKYNNDKDAFNSNPGLGINMEMLAFGAAMGGNNVHAEQLRKTCKKYQIQYEEKVFLYELIIHAMIGGNLDYGSKLYDEHGVDVGAMEAGLSFVSNMSDIERLSKKYDLNSSCILARAASFHGNEEYCSQLLNDPKWRTDPVYRSNVKSGMLLGCFASGNFYLSELRKHALLSSELLGDLKMLNFSHIHPFSIEFDLCLVNSAECGYFNFFISEYKKNHNYHLIEKSLKIGRLELPIFLYNNPSFYMKKKQFLILNDIRESIASYNLFSSLAIALHQLSFIDDFEFLNALKDHILLPDYTGVIREELRSKQRYIADVIPQAIKINQIRKKYDLDFYQAQAFLNQYELRQLILLCFPFNLDNRFGHDIALIIMKQLSSLSLQSTYELYDKVSVKVNQTLLAHDLKHLKINKELSTPSIKNVQHLLQVSHKERTESFLQASKNVDNRETLKSLIKYQKDLFDGVVKPKADSARPKHEQPFTSAEKGDYAQKIEKHARRFR